MPNFVFLPVLSKLNNFIFLITSTTCLTIIFACQPETQIYQKEFTLEERKKLTDQMTNHLIGRKGRYYQGSVSEVMVLEECIRLYPEWADLYREIGIPYGKRGLAAEFHEPYSKAVEKDPVNWQGWRGYMYLYFYRDYEQAIADFDALDPLTPNHVDYPQATSIHFMRAIAYLKLDDYDTALVYFDQHIKEELRTTTEDYIDLKTFLFQGIAYYKKGDFEPARNSFQKGLKYADYNADLWYWLAKTELALDNKEAAKIAIEKAATQFAKGDFNYRSYVEEFFQTYQSDIAAVQAKILYMD